MPGQTRREQCWSASGIASIGREHKLVLPLTGGLRRLKGHDQCPVDVVGGEVGAGEVKPREGEAARTGEGAVTAFPGPIARELFGDKRRVRHNDLGLAERRPEIRRGCKSGSVHRTWCLTKSPAGIGFPADENLSRWADGNRGALVAADSFGELEGRAEARALIGRAAEQNLVAPRAGKVC